MDGHQQTFTEFFSPPHRLCTELARSFLDRAVNYALAVRRSSFTSSPLTSGVAAYPALCLQKSIKEEALTLFRSIPRITRRATAESVRVRCVCVRRAPWLEHMSRG